MIKASGYRFRTNDMYALYIDGDDHLIITHYMYSSNGIMALIVKSNNTKYIEGKAHRIYIHDSTIITEYQTLEELLDENFCEFL